MPVEVTFIVKKTVGENVLLFVDVDKAHDKHIIEINFGSEGGISLSHINTEKNLLISLF